MGCLRWVWGITGHRRLQSEIDRIVAAGEPLFPKDFDSPSVPDEDNAVLVLREAEQASTGQGNQLLDLTDDRHTHASSGEEVRTIVEANTKALGLIRRARSLQAVDWGVRIRSPVMESTAVVKLSPQRDLAKLVAGAARHAHYTGADSVAIAELRDLLVLSARLEKRPTLIAHLGTLAQSALCAHTVETIAPHVTLADRAPKTDRPDAAPAGRDQLQALIGELLDERGTQESLLLALHCERMVELDGIQAFRDEVTGFAFAPLADVAGARLLRDLSHVVAMVTQRQDWPAMRAWFVGAEAPASGLARFASLFRRVTIPSLRHAVELHYRAVCDRRMAATALAIRLYELDHDRRPEKLAEMVPDYIPRVPADAFGEEGRAIGYLPDADPPILYSVGANAVDDQGKFALRPQGRIDYEVGDAPFFLNGDRPEPQ